MTHLLAAFSDFTIPFYLAAALCLVIFIWKIARAMGFGGGWILSWQDSARGTSRSSVDLESNLPSDPKKRKKEQFRRQKAAYKKEKRENWTPLQHLANFFWPPIMMVVFLILAAVAS